MLRSRLVVTKQTPLAPNGMVVAEHPRGAEVGAAILARGGNAVDAAVATAFAMTVIEPFMSTIAGSGTMLVHLRRRGETVALDFNVSAPLSAHERLYRLTGGVSRALFTWPSTAGDENLYGYRSVAVPGSVAGLTLALARYGTMALRDVLQPAIDLAAGGLIPDWYLGLTIARYAEEISAFPATARTYLRDGRWIHRPPQLTHEGDRAVFADLAESLRLIARDGAAAFYRGAIAQAIAEDMAAHGGYVTREDLAAYEVRVSPPLAGRYRDLDLVLSPGATGGITALEMLNILEQFPPAQVGWRTPGGLHRRAQACAQAFRDRLEHLGDAAVTKAPWERLASKAYARTVARGLRGAGAGAARPRPGARRGADDCTTHVSVVDRDRNMVSLTHTAVSLFGSRVVVPGTGILLNNGMIWFDPEPGKPNSVGPGKRALVNMVPVLGFRNGQPALTLGAPGGRRIISAIPQVLANLVDERCAPQAAIEAPRLHDEGEGLLVDDRAGEAALAGLARRGHTVVAREETYSTLNFARPVAIRVGRRGLEAGLDHLGAAGAAGH
jgi:gamma-glutamyltranspeptidase/glutathione hydrolase